ncbi:MAG: hypothetical protein P857_602 [Candidatus Xenolissoclinum pacificiensis L6]|uniref:Uncharacterized protein n=1 Tax=Candidatus Xenolissoclinum pacificiensis L6 TaxID=1401685 RepID=W2UYB6_9RICK|nr:MAG: hypothetical protein P857_602 [Candidatus Xenolissoclinum pacificiensis L6]
MGYKTDSNYSLMDLQSAKTTGKAHKLGIDGKRSKEGIDTL